MSGPCETIPLSVRCAWLASPALACARMTIWSLVAAQRKTQPRTQALSLRIPVHWFQEAPASVARATTGRRCRPLGATTQFGIAFRPNRRTTVTRTPRRHQRRHGTTTRARPRFARFSNPPNRPSRLRRCQSACLLYGRAGRLRVKCQVEGLVMTAHGKGITTPCSVSD